MTYTQISGSHVALVAKNIPANAGDIRSRAWSLHQEDPLEEDIATHASILTWRIPWTEEPGEPQSMVFQSRTQLKWLSKHTQIVKTEWPLIFGFKIQASSTRKFFPNHEKKLYVLQLKFKFSWTSWIQSGNSTLKRSLVKSKFDLVISVIRH